MSLNHPTTAEISRSSWLGINHAAADKGKLVKRLLIFTNADRRAPRRVASHAARAASESLTQLEALHLSVPYKRLHDVLGLNIGEPTTALNNLINKVQAEAATKRSPALISSLART